jgi:AraC family transcriptional regulator
VGYSLYHFCRVFNRVIHHTPYDYLMRRRLSESARELVETDRRIVEIAFDYCFGSHETYSRAFRRMFDVQPSRWRKRGRRESRRLMPRLTRQYIQHINKGAGLRPVLVEMDVLHLAGVMTLVTGEREKVRELWDLLAWQPLGDEGRAEQRNCFGLALYPDDWQRRGFFYLAAREVDASGGVAPWWVRKTVPAQQYARFCHRGPPKDLGLTLDYIYHTWLPKSGWRLALPLEIECYGQDPKGDEGKPEEVRILIPLRS